MIPISFVVFAGHMNEFVVNHNHKILVPEYDYYSIMHGRTDYFSIGPGIKTIQVKDPTVNEELVGQRFNLSSKDILRIRRLYNCEPKADMLENPRNINPALEELFSQEHTIMPKSSDSVDTARLTKAARRTFKRFSYTTENLPSTTKILQATNFVTAPKVANESESPISISTVTKTTGVTERKDLTVGTISPEEDM